MRSAALNAARLLLLAGPTALAFFAGGYFDGPRAWAGALAWLLVAVGVIFGPRLSAPARPVCLAIGGLALLAAWTLLSIVWAPIGGDAYGAGQITFLYLGMLVAATLLLRGAGVRRLVEPVLAAGTLIVIGYGLSERLLPGVLHFARSVSAEGRLEQPLTYWNATGELAALGFVLCARIAGDATRKTWLRTAAVAAAAPLGLGLYLSFSRGALFACAAGLVVLVTVAPRREQLRAILLTVAAAALASVSAAPFRGLTSLVGTPATRERQGAIVLALLALVMLVATGAQWRLTRRERVGALRMPARTPSIAVAAICAGLALAIVFGAKEHSRAPLSGGASRYVSLQSNRYDYWGVALRAFGDEPLRGVGAGGWAVYWLRDRTIDEFAQDAHSLPLQTLAELGLVGFVLLFTCLGGITWAAVQAQRLEAGLVAGPIAGFAAYIAHSPLDWDWQMPAVTLVAIVLAGAILATVESARVAQRASAMRGASRRKIQTANPHTAT
jgi:uncharacterized integral membrane protein